MTAETLSLIKDLLLVILSFTGVMTGFIYNNRALRQKTLENERAEIYKKLNAFYGPMQQYLEQSRQLYQMFISEREEGFRTIKFLLEGDTLEGNDKFIFEEILSTVNQARKLIIERSGLVDDKDMRGMLAKASVHFRLLHLAYEKKLMGDFVRFEQHVYPKELDRKICEQIDELKMRLEQLNKL